MEKLATFEYKTSLHQSEQGSNYQTSLMTSSWAIAVYGVLIMIIPTQSAQLGC